MGSRVKPPVHPPQRVPPLPAGAGRGAEGGEGAFSGGVAPGYPLHAPAGLRQGPVALAGWGGILFPIPPLGGG